MVQATMNKHDLRGQHKSSVKGEDAVCDLTASTGGNTMGGTFFPEGKKSVLLWHLLLFGRIWNLSRLGL